MLTQDNINLIKELETKEQIRRAVVALYILKPRCRKEETHYVEAYGKDDEAVNIALKSRIKDTLLAPHKSYHIADTYYIQDATRTIDGRGPDYARISYVLFDHKRNVLPSSALLA